MRLKRIGVLLAMLLVGGALGASSAAPPKVALVSRPATVPVGAAWQATLVVRGPGTPALVATQGAATHRFATRRVGAQRFRARVVLQRAGGWRLEALLSGRRYPLGIVRAAPPPAELLLGQPTSAAFAPDGSLLVVENSRGRVLGIDPATGVARPVAVGIDRSYGVAFASDGDVLVSGATNLFRFDVTSGARTLLARSEGADLGPLVVSGDSVYVGAAPDSVLRIAEGGGAPVVVASGLGSPHGLAFQGDALLVSETANDRVIRLHLETGDTEVVAAGLDDPGALVLDRGRILVTEMAANSLTMIDAAGAVTEVARFSSIPMGLAVTPGGVVYVGTFDGRMHVVRDGAVSALRLRGP